MNYPFRMIIACFLLFAGTALNAQQKKDNRQDKAAVIRENVEGKHFRFVAQSVLPLRGGMRQLTSLYDLRVSGDSVMADLPYFGRAYAAPINMTGGGIQFTSTKNDYVITPKSKGGWDIRIRPSAAGTDTRELQLTVYTNGRATLRVMSNNRDAISFNGYVAENYAR